jgi:hypothetical protein
MALNLILSYPMSPAHPILSSLVNLLLLGGKPESLTEQYCLLTQQIPNFS